MTVMATFGGLKIANVLGGGNEYSTARTPRFNQGRVLWGDEPAEWKECRTHHTKFRCRQGPKQQPHRVIFWKFLEKIRLLKKFTI
ncbi:MAG: hypothetical protein DMG65_12685 [Candidatus Angelobacter sp. Gp1-AA117]|nr:MAG: hypothetical protein DMG65_12685 [Candidatus Angelobacter sp. Gp1-AA117]